MKKEAIALMCPILFQTNSNLMQLLRFNDDEEELQLMVMFFTYFENEEHMRILGFQEEYIDQYIEYDFFQLFRMSRISFRKLLCAIMSDEIEKPYRGGEIPISVEKKLLITLWWLGKGETLISIADRFNVAQSTAFTCANQILERLIIGLKDKYIVWPNNEELLTVEAQFRNIANYPGVVGAIDVCNVNFKAPANVKNSYIDRKMNSSIKLQAVCTPKRIFTNIMVGCPGSIHDSGVLRMSQLYNAACNNIYLCFPNANYHLVGDKAYPLKSWLITPFRDNGNMNEMERNHNISHSKSRIIVEHTFGILKSRWRILNFVNVNCIEKAVNLIVACCILHNFCYMNNDVWDDFELDTGNDLEHNLHGAANEYAGIQKRNEIARFFSISGLNKLQIERTL